MTRTPVTPKDITTAIVTSINGATVNGGTLSAKVDGSTIRIIVHSDATVPTYPGSFELVIH